DGGSGCGALGRCGADGARGGGRRPGDRLRGPPELRGPDIPGHERPAPRGDSRGAAPSVVGWWLDERPDGRETMDDRLMTPAAAEHLPPPSVAREAGSPGEAGSGQIGRG